MLQTANLGQNEDQNPGKVLVCVSRSSRLAGMCISHIGWADGGTDTVLEGQLIDQAAFTGVINTLYSLHFTVM